MNDLYLMAGLVLAAIFAYRFHRAILQSLARFDARNIARKIEELRDRRDHLAHYRHTLRLAEEQVDEVTELRVPDERTGLPATRFLFAGEAFSSRDEAEAARKQAILAKAREFYVELPAALSRRGDGKLR